MRVVGLVCKLLLRPLDDKWFMSPQELAIERQLAHERTVTLEVSRQTGSGAERVHPMLPIMAWLVVGLPLVWGVYHTLQSVAKFMA